MKKFKLVFLSFIICGSNIFAQSFGEKIKARYSQIFGSNDNHFMVRFNPVNYEEASNNLIIDQEGQTKEKQFLNNISIAYIYNDKLVFGISSYNSVIDIRNDGSEPIIDGQFLFGRTFYVEYDLLTANVKANENLQAILDDFYVSMHFPFRKNEEVHDVSQMDAVKIGFGLRYKLLSFVNFDIGYNRYLNNDINDGFNKGITQFGLSFVF
jgi:hypothetical protein